jgi:hypothetical protein
MVRLTILVLVLASPALLAAEAPPSWQDGLTLSPVATVQTHFDESAAAVDLKEPAPQEMIVDLEQPISLDARAVRTRRSSDELGGFIYEPVYTSGDRIEYQLGSGLGLGVATDAAWSISHSVRLGRGLDLSVYYLRAMGDGSRGTVRGVGPETGLVTPEASAGIRLEWKF